MEEVLAQVVELQWVEQEFWVQTPQQANFLLAPFSLVLGNLSGVIPRYTEICTGRWDYE